MEKIGNLPACRFAAMAHRRQPNLGMAALQANGIHANSGASTGLNAFSNQSIVSFGFIDETWAMPTDYIAAFAPLPGLNDSDVLSDLASLFNDHYAARGYTASYDLASDCLTIDQPAPIDLIWSANSDTGLDLVVTTNTVASPPAGRSC
jgi:hypothetical protein